MTREEETHKGSCVFLVRHGRLCLVLEYVRDVWKVWLKSSVMSRTRSLESTHWRHGSGEEMAEGGSHIHVDPTIFFFFNSLWEMHANYLLQTNITTYTTCWKCVTLIFIVPLLLGIPWKSSEEQQCETGVERKINVETVCVFVWQLCSSYYFAFIVVWIPDCLCKIGSGVGYIVTDTILDLYCCTFMCMC